MTDPAANRRPETPHNTDWGEDYLAICRPVTLQFAGKTASEGRQSGEQVET